jgi:hypothetical protein
MGDFLAAHLCLLNPVAQFSHARGVAMQGDLYRPYHPAEINHNQAL